MRMSEKQVNVLVGGALLALLPLAWLQYRWIGEVAEADQQRRTRELAAALERRPLLGRGVAADLLALSYISVCVVYLGWTAAHYVMDARDMREVAHFMGNKLGISESKARGTAGAGGGGSDPRVATEVSREGWGQR